MKKIFSDLTVVGGGIAGMTCAITAARHGLKVALVEVRDVLGGNHSSQCRVSFCGSGRVNDSVYARESGMVDEIKLTLSYKNPRDYYKEDCHLSDMAFYDMVTSEPNISLFLGTAVYDATVENAKIVEVKGRKTRTEEEYSFISPLYADGSGDGIVGYKAGAEFRYGREAKAEFNERYAPEESDAYTMGSTILFTVSKADKPVPFVKPDFAYDYKKDGILEFCNRPNTGRGLPTTMSQNMGLQDMGLWWLEFGGMLDAIEDDDKIDIELKKLVYGFWDYVKNSGDYKDVENHYISWIAPHLTKRESRRFIGDYVLSQNDIENQVDFYDSVAVGGWSIDVHDYGGVYGTGLASIFGKIHGLYNIPYRMMYSKNILNLFLLGRITSATHVALGSIRVMATLGNMAQAVGTAAALCKKYSVCPREISKEGRIEELQEILLKDGQYIANRQSSVGKAQNAIITATETCIFENLYDERSIKLDKPIITGIPLSDKKLESLQIKVKNDGESKALKIKLFSSYNNDCYEIDKLVEEIEIDIPQEYVGWITIAPKNAVFSNNIGLMFFETCEGVSLFCSENHVTGTPILHIVDGIIYSRYKSENAGRHLSLTFRGLKPANDLLSPNNLVNGLSRPLGLPNSWKAMIANKPELTLDFSEPTDVKEIQILFNGQLEEDLFHDLPPYTLPIDFTVTVEHSKGVEVIEVKKNFLALKRFFVDIKEVKKIRFGFVNTYGSPYIEVFAVKVF